MGNDFLENNFYKKEKRLRRNYEIEDEVYEFLYKASREFNASQSDILNACLKKLRATEDFRIYTKKDTIYPTHVFKVDQSNIAALNEMKKKTGFSINVLVNMAIRNIMKP